VNDLVTIVPSRGRPQAAAEMVTAFERTRTASTHLVFAVDRDDPKLEEYISLLLVAPRTWVDIFVAPAPSTMVKTLNAAALQFAPKSIAVAFMGDDHRPRTSGWDHHYLHALRMLNGTGMVYGNDLFQGVNIPTQIAITANIVRALGHMAPPTLTHLYVDNYWRDLGRAAECITYLPNVAVEHLHPFAGKAAMDDGYLRVNAPAMYDADGAAYRSYVADGHLTADIQKVRALRVP
jgi:hypothetical protein